MERKRRHCSKISAASEAKVCGYAGQSELYVFKVCRQDLSEDSIQFLYIALSPIESPLLSIKSSWMEQTVFHQLAVRGYHIRGDCICDRVGIASVTGLTAPVGRPAGSHRCSSKETLGFSSARVSLVGAAIGRGFFEPESAFAQQPFFSRVLVSSTQTRSNVSQTVSLVGCFTPQLASS